jgi:hypothetical protein
MSKAESAEWLPRMGSLGKLFVDDRLDGNRQNTVLEPRERGYK